MVFDFTDEQRALRAGVADFLDDGAGWRTLAEQMGLVGLLAPPGDGGAGGGPVELAIVCEEMGRRLDESPYLSSAVLATTLLRELGEHELIAELAAGRRVATVAVAERALGWDASAPVTRRDPRGAVTGTKDHVTDVAGADVFLVVTRDGVVAVDARARGVRVVPGRALDAGRSVGTVEFDEAPGCPIEPAGAVSATDAVQRTLRVAEAALAAEQAGGARAALDMAVAHAGRRYQFGRAIGSFQAIKHLCAELFVDVESAFSAAYRAAWELADDGAGSGDVGATVALAQAFCSDTFVRAATDNIQIHGGIGFTWEHPAHRYLRRARSSAQLLGAPEVHRERLVRAMTPGSGQDPRRQA